VLGAVGGDEWGQRFRTSLQVAGVDTSRLQVDDAKSTGRCAVLITPDGQRTMRTALAGAASLPASSVRGAATSFQGVSWVSVTAFAYYSDGLVDAVVERTRAAGAKLILHLAAKEVVRAFGRELNELLTSGAVSLLFANEDEAAQFMRTQGLPTDPGALASRRVVRAAAAHAHSAPAPAPAESAVRHLATMCDTAVVTVGARGCLAMRGDVLVHEPAVSDVRCVDSTGAGDLFAAGFMFAMLNDLALAACVRLGCLSGAAVIMVRWRLVCRKDSRLTAFFAGLWRRGDA
jgi:sugar/nucleoside kinase (ribokinase family)